MVLTVKVKPKSGKDRILRVNQQGILEVELRAKPENNQANESLVSFLAKLLQIEKGQIKILQGLKERKKIIKIEGLSEEEFFSRVKL